MSESADFLPPRPFGQLIDTADALEAAQAERDRLRTINRELTCSHNDLLVAIVQLENSIDARDTDHAKIVRQLADEEEEHDALRNTLYERNEQLTAAEAEIHRLRVRLGWTAEELIERDDFGMPTRGEWHIPRDALDFDNKCKYHFADCEGQCQHE